MSKVKRTKKRFVEEGFESSLNRKPVSNYKPRKLKGDEEASLIALAVVMTWSYPPPGSWLNMAEIELSHLSRQCLDKRIENKGILKTDVMAWNNERNKKKVIANWQFTTEDAQIKLRKLYPTIKLGSGTNTVFGSVKYKWK